MSDRGAALQHSLQRARMVTTAAAMPASYISRFETAPTSKVATVTVELPNALPLPDEPPASASAAAATAVALNEKPPEEE